MHYLIDMGDGETYAVCNFGTVRWISDKPLRFNVVTYAGFNDEDVNVYANGKALTPDADGYYTLQKLESCRNLVHFICDFNVVKNMWMLPAEIGIQTQTFKWDGSTFLRKKLSRTPGYR